MDSNCWARVGELEFGPLSLNEFVLLANDRSLPDELEFRIDRSELWWHWPSIVQFASQSHETTCDCLGNWFVRTGDRVDGPFTVEDVTQELLLGRLSTEIEIQIGNGPWRHVTELLVLINEPDVATSEPTPTVTSIPAPTVPTELPKQEQNGKSRLESWFAETMPERNITVAVVPRLPTGTLKDIVEKAMSRVLVEAEEVAKELSHPWIWGGLAVLPIFTIFFFWLQRTGPDELEVQAYHRLKAVAEAIRAVRATNPSEQDWKEFADQQTRELESIKEELSEKKQGNKPIKELLFWAVEYRLPRILEEGRLTPSPAEHHFDENLKQAAKLLGAAAH